MNKIIEDLPNLDNYNLEQMTADIECLKSDFDELSTNLSTIKGNSLSTMETLDTQISTLNTSISTINTSLDENSAQISTNSNDISSLKTTTKNNSTTITNLTSTQNNLTNTVSGINTRLTSAEQELSAITGGVDLTELDERVANIEPRTAITYTCGHVEQNYNLTTKYYATPYFPFYSNKCPVVHNIKLKYLSNASGTLTITCYTLSVQTLKKFTINLVEFPTEYNFSLEHFAVKNVAHIYLKFSASEVITIKGVVIDTFGSSVVCTNYLPEIDVQCFDNKMFVTKREEDGISYGCFSADEDLDINNLPNKFLYINEDGSRYSYAVYLPYTTFDETTLTYTGYTDGILVGDKFIPKNLTSTLETPLESNIGLYNYEATFYTVGVGATPALAYFSVGSDAVYYKEARSGSSNGIMLASHIFTNLVRNNNQGIGSSYVTNSTQIKAIGLKELDGCFYLKMPDNVLIKFDRLDCVWGTAYLQADGSINIYLTNKRNTYKYSVSFDEDNNHNVKYISTYKKCDCVYELYNNKQLRHNPFSKSWLVV